MNQFDVPSIEPTLGSVVETDRGSLPFSLIHGESLVACAAWALGDAGVDLVDLGTTWSELALSGVPVALHDVLCPMTPASFIADAVNASAAQDAVVVGVRPVTDTVKELDGGALGATVDRDGLWQVASPLVLPAAVVAFLSENGDGLPSTDFGVIVDHLVAAGFTVVPLPAPAEARRVGSIDEIRLVEALTAHRGLG